MKDEETPMKFMNVAKKYTGKLTAKAMVAANNAACTLKNNDGMEVVQVLIIIIVSITLGGLLLTAFKEEFQQQIEVVSQKLTSMFS